jgi:ribosomal protein S18 acetylase RimI-like enzyme
VGTPQIRAVRPEEYSEVAELDGRLVGAVTLAPHGSDWAEAAQPGDAVIRMLAVHPDVRGAGTGEALVRACVDLARETGCVRILLSTEPTMTVAHRLYQRLGFVRTPSDDWEPVPGVSLLGYRLELS